MASTAHIEGDSSTWQFIHYKYMYFKLYEVHDWLVACDGSVCSLHFTEAAHMHALHTLPNFCLLDLSSQSGEAVGSNASPQRLASLSHIEISNSSTHAGGDKRNTTNPPETTQLLDLAASVGHTHVAGNLHAQVQKNWATNMARRLFRRLWRLTTARIFFTNHACMQPSSSCVQSQSSCMQAKPVLQTGVSSLPAESCLWKYIDVHKVSAWACTTCSRSCPVSSVAGEATLGTAKLQPVVAAQGSNSWTLQAWVAAQAQALFVPAGLWAEEVGAPLSPFLLLEQVQRQVGHSFLKGLSVQGAFPLLLLSLFLQVSGLLQQVLWPKALVLAWPLPVGPWPWIWPLQ